MQIGKKIITSGLILPDKRKMGTDYQWVVILFYIIIIIGFLFMRVYSAVCDPLICAIFERANKQGQTEKMTLNKIYSNIKLLIYIYAYIN